MKLLEISGLIITFIAFAIVGYCLPINITTKAEEVIVAYGNNIPQDEINDAIVEQITQDSISTSQPQDPASNAVIEGSNSTPKIINTYIGKRNTKNIPGLPLTVSAEVESGDNLVCIIKLNEASTDIVAEAPMTNGKCSFPNLMPTDNGTYYICVRNATTGESVSEYKNGFNKITKWSAAELTKQLNAEHLDKMFFHHFNTETLTFDCEGIDPNNTPKEIDRLRNGCSAYGWILTVTETPKYDQYNRITYFKVKISE